jgi:3-hydroxypropanoate dehydrogenase
MPPKSAVSKDCINQIFREARTHNEWLPEPVSPELLRHVYDLAALGPTSANSTPARYVFLTTAKAKERLRPALSPANVEKTMAAPVTVEPGFPPATRACPSTRPA